MVGGKCRVAAGSSGLRRQRLSYYPCTAYITKVGPAEARCKLQNPARAVENFSRLSSFFLFFIKKQPGEATTVTSFTNSAVLPMSLQGGHSAD